MAQTLPCNAKESRDYQFSLPCVVSGHEILWQSDHYLAFTRVSLYHFASLDQRDITSKLDKQIVLAFWSMRVTWFVLFLIFLLKKPFLQRQSMSCWGFFYHLAEDFGFLEKGTVKINGLMGSQNQIKVAKKERLMTTNQIKPPKNHPILSMSARLISWVFWTYLKWLSNRKLESWEGDNESYIQNVKREISTMKHNEHYLKTILTKILRTEVLDYFNKDNPFSKEKNIHEPVMFGFTTKVWSTPA